MWPAKRHSLSGLSWVLGSPPVGRSLEHLGRRLEQVSELPCLNAKEQKLYSEVVSSDWASPPKEAPSHLAEEPHFRHLYLQSLPFGRYPKFLTTGESGITALSFHSTVRNTGHITAGAAPITPCQPHTPSFPHSWTWETLWGRTSPPESHLCPVENHSFGLGGGDSNLSCYTLGCKPPQYILKVPAWWIQQETSSAKSRDDPVTTSNPARVQHAPETGLTYCWQCNPSSCSGHTTDPTDHRGVPPRTPRGHVRMPIPDQQNTFCLVEQTHINAQVPRWGHGAGPVFLLYPGFNYGLDSPLLDVPTQYCRDMSTKTALQCPEPWRSQSGSLRSLSLLTWETSLLVTINFFGSFVCQNGPMGLLFIPTASITSGVHNGHQRPCVHSSQLLCQCPLPPPALWPFTEQFSDSQFWRETLTWPYSGWFLQ